MSDAPTDRSESMKNWTEYSPSEAKDRYPNGALEDEDLKLPVNEFGERCPWPWEPQQLVGAPMGQYHCPYCGAMCVAGIPHIDYSEDEVEKLA